VCIGGLYYLEALAPGPGPGLIGFWLPFWDVNFRVTQQGNSFWLVEKTLLIPSKNPAGNRDWLGALPDFLGGFTLYSGRITPIFRAGFLDFGPLGAIFITHYFGPNH